MVVFNTSRRAGGQFAFIAYLRPPQRMDTVAHQQKIVPDRPISMGGAILDIIYSYSAIRRLSRENGTPLWSGSRICCCCRCLCAGAI
jgi:hypothetical protein